MPIDRRRLLAAGALAAAGPALAEPAPATPSVEQRLIAKALENLHPMAFDGRAFSGPGWELLLREGRASEFVLLGEEHGTREIPLLARELFLALAPAGFEALAIEISPPIAEDLDRAALGGVDGIRRFVEAWPPGPAFYFWRTEAELIAAVRAAAPKGREALWGLDYEVTGDRRLIARLKAKAPASARTALAALDKASTDAWAKWRTTHDPGVLFTFAGDPALVRAVRAAWPRPDADASAIMTTLEETLEINALFPNRGWESNERRSALMRANFARHLKAAEPRRPKVMVKMGESHVMRGVSWAGTFDVGSLVPEAAALRGGRAFSVLAGGGQKAMHGVLDPTRMATAPAPVDMLDELGLGFLVAALPATPGPMLIDLRPLRPIVSNTARLKALNNPEAVRVIFAVDAMVVWNGTTPAEMLQPV
jgi:hypothetical protein